MSQAYFLRFTSHQTALSKGLLALLTEGYGTDVLLSAGQGQQLPAHRIILSAFSPYFKTLFSNVSANQFPIVIIKEMSNDVLQTIIDFCYRGEILVPRNKLPEIVAAAKFLEIEGAKDFVLPPEAESAFETHAKKSDQRKAIDLGKKRPAEPSIPKTTPFRNGEISTVTIDDEDDDEDEDELPPRKSKQSSYEDREEIVCIPDVVNESSSKSTASGSSGMFSEFESQDSSSNRPLALTVPKNKQPATSTSTNSAGSSKGTAANLIRLKLPTGTVLSTKVTGSSGSSPICKSVLGTHTQEGPLVPNMKTLQLTSATARAIAASISASLKTPQSKTIIQPTESPSPQRLTITQPVYRTYSNGTPSSTSSSMSMSLPPPITISPPSVTITQTNTSSLMPPGSVTGWQPTARRGRGRPPKHMTPEPSTSTPAPSLSAVSAASLLTHSLTIQRGRRGRPPRSPFLSYSPSSRQFTLQRPTDQPLGRAQHKCPHCPQVYYGANAMQDHITSVHMNSGARYVCGICKKEYTWRITLRKHLKFQHKMDPDKIPTFMKDVFGSVDQTGDGDDGGGTQEEEDEPSDEEDDEEMDTDTESQSEPRNDGMTKVKVERPE